MSEFVFEPASFVPFKDKKILDKVRTVHGKDLEKYSNEKMNIKVIKNPHPIIIGDIFTRIKMSDEQDRKQVLILGNPEPETYIPVAELINYHKVNCRNVYIFAMDEWADQDGNIAPVTYKASFSNSMLKYFVYQIDPGLRMPESNVFYPTKENFKDYSKMITETGEGGADVCYSSPGWAGHIAFVDPSEEFLTDSIEDYLKQDAKIVTLHPLTICQNSLHGVFGQSGDIANVPPKAATIGPADVVRSRERIELHSLQTMGTFVSWQRMISRLILLGPVTPYVPSSIFQILKTQVYVSEEVAAPFECWETVGY
ncbi:MAG: glucosamine-6-phosphate deaminase [Actinobacteria bacterium ADurb.Bin346]|nr:MAG: glucosamine-6-phosphate deaminase [Actinobacteria bacterium ADurb.Bin346]